MPTSFYLLLGGKKTDEKPKHIMFAIQFTVCVTERIARYDQMELKATIRITNYRTWMMQTWTKTSLLLMKTACYYSIDQYHSRYILITIYQFSTLIVKVYVQIFNILKYTSVISHNHSVSLLYLKLGLIWTEERILHWKYMHLVM